MRAYRLAYNNRRHFLSIETSLPNFNLAIRLKEQEVEAVTRQLGVQSVPFVPFAAFGKPWGYWNNLCSTQVEQVGQTVIRTDCRYPRQAGKQYDWLTGLSATASIDWLLSHLFAFEWANQDTLDKAGISNEGLEGLSRKRPLILFHGINHWEELGDSQLCGMLSADFLLGLRKVWEKDGEGAVQAISAAMQDAAKWTLGKTKALTSRYRTSLLASMSGYQLNLALPCSIGYGSVCGTKSCISQVERGCLYEIDCGNMEQPEQAMVALAGLAAACELVEKEEME